MTPTSSRRALPITLNLIGAAFISYDLTGRSLRDQPPVIVGVAGAAIAAWVVATVLPERFARPRTALYVVMIGAGSFVACGTDILGFVPGIVGLLIYIGRISRSWQSIAGAAAASTALVSIGAVVAGAPVSLLVTALSIGLTVVLGALSRRQFRSAEAQSRALLEERLAVEQERALVATLTERSRIARDLHDVLAHSLGGLVIQLDAVDALLESGRTAEARRRVIAARRLAVDGLDEAKRAVTTLREPERDTVGDLLRTHRDLGGEATVDSTGVPGAMSADARTAFRRALQELLTNARRHAPGVPVTLTLDWAPTELTVTTSTAAPRTLGTGGGGGHGLVGMRERVEAVGGSMTVRTGDPFTVVLTLPTKEGTA